MLRDFLRWHSLLWIAGGALLLVASLALLYGRQANENVSEPAPNSATEPPRGGSVTRTEMRNVIFYAEDGLPLNIHFLNGKLLPTRNDKSPSFDEKSSFMIEIETGEIGLSPESLTNLMNQHVFAYHGAPIKDLKVSIEGSQLKQTGTLKKGIPIPFSMTANIEVTDDGRLRLHPTKFKVLHMPAKGLMKAFDLELDDLVNVKGARGVEVHDDDLILDPENILPSPQIRGKVSAVRVANGEVLQTFGPPAGANTSSHMSDAKNYMAFRGGVLRFGKLTMRDADLTLVDATQRDAFFFSIDRYNEQLVAGYSKTTPDLGLVVFMPDINEVQSKSAHLVAVSNQPSFRKAVF